MVRLRVADGGDGLHIWREAANVLNKQSLPAVKEWNLTDTAERPRQRKMDMRIGSQNIRSSCTSGSLKTVAREVAKCSGTWMAFSQQTIVEMEIVN
jgi:hypothetical protein